MSNVIEKLAISNRGEIAVRIIRACQELGIQTVLLHSEPDIKTLAYRLSDEQICIGPGPSSESYLNIENNINGALACGADAIHPGFGFLSENAEFAKACKKNNLTFIGPSAEAIALFGDKISAKQLVKSIGGPVIEGYEGSQKNEQETKHLAKKAEEIGYPVIVKAAAGGGGRGLKVIYDKFKAEEIIESAKRESLHSFGSDKVFLEKYLSSSKHIEFQIFVEASGQVFHLFERECSVQRRHQKIIEEALSPSLSPELRDQMAQTAKTIAQKANYRGAGTIEFLLDKDKYYFLEMNTRLQVEHPVTEMILGIDLVKAQILTAMDQSTTWDSNLECRGHAIECRIYAEDPYAAGLPSTGQILDIHWPQGPGRRFDFGFTKGDEINIFYDSMIAKVIVWDENRSRAIFKMLACLKETIIFGVKTNIPQLIEILSHPEFVDATMSTNFMQKYFPKGLISSEFSQKEKDIARLIYKELKNKDELSPLVGSSDSPVTEAWFCSNSKGDLL